MSIFCVLKYSAFNFLNKIYAVNLTRGEKNFCFLPQIFGRYVAKTHLFKAFNRQFQFLDIDKFLLFCSTLKSWVLKTECLVLLHNQLEKSEIDIGLFSFTSSLKCQDVKADLKPLRFSTFIVYKFIVSIPSR